jgi:hypothetical protein
MNHLLLFSHHYLKTWTYEIFGLYVKSALCVCSFCTNVVMVQSCTFLNGKDFPTWCKMLLHGKPYQRIQSSNLFIFLFLNSNKYRKHTMISVYFDKKNWENCVSLVLIQLSLLWGRQVGGGRREGTRNKAIFCYLTIERNTMATTWNMIEWYAFT